MNNEKELVIFRGGLDSTIYPCRVKWKFTSFMSLLSKRVERRFSYFSCFVSLIMIINLTIK